MQRLPATLRLFAIALVTTVAADAADAQGPQTPPSAPVTVVNTAANPVRVAGSVGLSGPVAVQQSGTWTVTAQETFAPGRRPRRFGPIEAGFTGNLVGHELVPPVPAGQTFIVTHLNAVGFSGNSAVGLVRGSCGVQLGSGGIYTPFMLLPMVSSGSALAVNEQTFVPLAAGEGLYVTCSGVAADGTAPSQGARMTAGGYYVPAAP